MAHIYLKNLIFVNVIKTMEMSSGKRGLAQLVEDGNSKAMGLMSREHHVPFYHVHSLGNKNMTLLYDSCFSMYVYLKRNNQESPFSVTVFGGCFRTSDLV